MFDKLDTIVRNFEEIEKKLSTQEIIQDMSEFTELSKRHAELSEIVNKYKDYKDIKKHLDEAKELLNSNEKELKELAQLEIEENSDRSLALEEELKLMLLPKDPDDAKNVILEIRQGTGGEEAALFAANIYEMYQRYCEKNNWTLKVMSLSEADQGGIKEVIAEISGKDVYGRLKYESGTHRVQRVPKTETSGRIHTSAVTVAIMPEAEEVNVEINPADLRVDTYRASGAGGQHINKTDSAVRLTHRPSGLVVACQDGRSQIQNKEIAMKLLKTRLYEKEQNEKKEKESALRKSQVGSGDRSEKIRTYNYPQGRVTDHRINLTVHRLQEVLQGDLDEIIDALLQTERLESLKEL